jgi:hypothetical protein
MENTSKASTGGPGENQPAVAAMSHSATGRNNKSAGESPAPPATAPTPTAAELKRKMSVETRLLIIAQVLTLFTLIVLFIQTLVGQESFKLSASAAELSFNLDVMARNQDVNFIAAEDPDCYKYVWKEELKGKELPAPGSKVEQCGDAILDVLSMAIAAVDQMPGFSRNRGDDWARYTAYVMDSSPNLRNRVLAQKGWWPELEKYAKR